MNRNLDVVQASICAIGLPLLAVGQQGEVKVPIPGHLEEVSEVEPTTGWVSCICWKYQDGAQTFTID